MHQIWIFLRQFPTSVVVWLIMMVRGSKTTKTARLSTKTHAGICFMDVRNLERHLASVWIWPFPKVYQWFCSIDIVALVATAFALGSVGKYILVLLMLQILSFLSLNSDGVKFMKSFKNCDMLQTVEKSKYQAVLPGNSLYKQISSCASQPFCSLAT